MLPEETCKVELPGHGIFWLLADDGHGRPLSHLDECDDDGNLAPTSKDLVRLLSSGRTRISYAHMLIGTCKKTGKQNPILRFNELIGHAEDLRVV